VYERRADLFEHDPTPVKAKPPADQHGAFEPVLGNLQADWLWSLKDWIDHKWMAMYGPQLADMADMMRPPSAAQRQQQQQAAADAAGGAAPGVVALAAMRCGGCASKVHAGGASPSCAPAVQRPFPPALWLPVQSADVFPCPV
jgi:hypothetical protein